MESTLDLRRQRVNIATLVCNDQPVLSPWFEVFLGFTDPKAMSSRQIKFRSKERSAEALHHQHSLEIGGTG